VSVPELQAAMAASEPMAAARAAKRRRDAERRRLGEIHDRYEQAFHELAVLEDDDATPGELLRAARAAAYKVAHELVHARRMAGQPGPVGVRHRRRTHA
jgi:DNA-binding FadR family transcriptional regulator